jgi:lipid-A-disaccharide synthase
VVLIDYMGANINLGLRIKKRFPQVPINYYIAPQEWAFRLGDGGTMRLLGFTDRILAIFPEEARFYGERGADVLWVGHPCSDTLSELPDRQAARQRLGLAEGERLLLVLPASRHPGTALPGAAPGGGSSRIAAAHRVEGGGAGRPGRL